MSRTTPQPGPASHHAPAVVFAGLLSLFVASRRARRVPLLCGMLLLLPLSLGLGGCGGSGSSSTTPPAPTLPPLTANVTLSGQDSVNGVINNAVTFAATISQ